MRIGKASTSGLHFDRSSAPGAADAVARTRRGRHPGAVARQADRRRLVDGRGGALPGQRTIRQLARHEAARAALRLQVAFRRQLVVGASSPSTATRAGDRRARAWTGSARPARSGRTGCRPATGRRSAGAAGSGRGGSGRSGPAWLSSGPGWPSSGLRPGAQPRASGLYENIRSGACAQSTCRLPYEHAAGAITRAAVRPRPPTSCAGRMQERHDHASRHRPRHGDQRHRHRLRRRRVPRRGELRRQPALPRRRGRAVPQRRQPPRRRPGRRRLPAGQGAGEDPHPLLRRHAGAADRRRLPAGRAARRRPRHPRRPQVRARRPLLRDRRRGDDEPEALRPRSAPADRRRRPHRRQLRDRRHAAAAGRERPRHRRCRRS